MTKVEQLILELCPKGVECKPLGELCSIITKQTGFDYSNHIKNSLLSERREDALPYIQTKFFTGKNFMYDTDYFIPLNVAERFPKILLDCKCLLFSIVGASIGNIGLFPGTVKAFCGGAICVAKPLQEYNIEYLYYYLSSVHGQKQIFNKVKGSGQATITIEDIRKFKIPLPPVSIQEEIVRILDELTEKTDKLILELNNELEDRRKQYNYYVGKILTFDENTPVYEIGDVCKLSAGGDAPKERMSKEKNDVYSIPIYSNGVGKNALYGFTDIPKITEHCVTVAARGTIGYSEVRKEPFYPIIRLICCVPTDKIDTEFLCYIIKTLKFKIPDGGIPQLTVPMLSKYKIHVPDLDIQKQIVSLLNKYSSAKEQMISSIQKEIDLHKKQYEYYRDKLLTFKEIENIE